MTGILLFLKTYWRPLGIAFLVIFIFGLGWHYKSVVDLDRQERALLKAQKQYNKASSEYEIKVQTLSKHAVDLNHELEQALVKDTDYSTCVLSPDGVSILNKTPSTR